MYKLVAFLIKQSNVHYFLEIPRLVFCVSDEMMLIEKKIGVDSQNWSHWNQEIGLTAQEIGKK